MTAAGPGRALPETPLDLLIVGGGVNGAGIARDAAGRGLEVALCEKGDLGEGTSSRSGKLIHGGLRYLEHYEFRLVREALIEREVLLRAAPHIVWPLRFVLPHSPAQRPAWLIRLGLLLYDHLGGRRLLPPTRALDLRSAPEGAGLKPAFRRAFEYSDCWVDDARLVVLNALDAAERGARILPRTACVRARRDGGLWHATLEDRATGERFDCRAACLVNAAGPWVEDVLGRVAGVNAASRLRLVKGSHIVTRKFWEGEQAYLLQNDDRRVIFVNPYEGDLALIGTTDVPVEGAPEAAAVEEAEIDYLLGVVARYFERPPGRGNVLQAFTGVRPLFDDAAESASAVTRDYVFDLEPVRPAPDQAPLLSIFGGKITTYRKLAEHALDRLRPFFPRLGAAWTAGAALPGGDIAAADFAGFERGLRAAFPWLPPGMARHYARLYGTRAEGILAGAGSLADLGRHFGGRLYEREARYLIDHEWAGSAEDVLERRSKHGLHLSAAERAAFAAWFERGEQARSA